VKILLTYRFSVQNNFSQQLRNAGKNSLKFIDKENPVAHMLHEYRKSSRSIPGNSVEIWTHGSKEIQREAIQIISA